MTGGGDPGGVEWVGAETEDVLDTSPRRRRAPNWAILVVAALAVVAGVIVVITRNDGPSQHRPVAAATSPPAADVTPYRDFVAPPPPRTAPPRRVPVVVTDVGHRLLGVRGNWELFGRGGGAVVRIQFARGRITRTTVPALASDGPVSFIVGPRQAVIRPLDYVPGYVVPDGRRATLARGALLVGGPAYPGPAPGLVWTQSTAGGVDALVLSRMDGRPAHPRRRIVVPSGFIPLGTDGAGHVLVSGVGGTYVAGPHGLTRITHGELLAAGPTRWLTYDCDRHGRCGSTVVDRGTGARHRLPGQPVGAPGPVATGSISPDGKTAVLFAMDPQTSGLYRLELLDLRTGQRVTPAVVVDAENNYDQASAMAWSPDGRWLFVVAADGGLRAVNLRTGHVRHLPAPLPKLAQLAIRPS